MNTEVIVEKYRDMFYRSRFSQLIYSLKSDNIHFSDLNLKMELVLLKSSAYAEMNEMEKAIDCLEECLRESDDDSSEQYLHTMARLSYMERNWDQTERLFLEALESGEDPKLSFKALLGLANTLYSNENKSFAEIEPILFDLTNYPYEILHQDKIALEIFLGNYEKNLPEKKMEDVLDHFDKALKMANEKDWNYLICRALYGKALVYEKYSKIDLMKCTLEILKSFIRENEHIFFGNIVNSSFERYEFKISMPVEFDYRNQRIKLDQDWLLLHERPLLYRFIEMIYKDKSFVSKRTLAKSLWPDQDYKPRIHDPRIFDLAKRTRKILNQSPSNQFELLSGRAGYKLGNSLIQRKEA